jgi:hypothetical protein
MGREKKNEIPRARKNAHQAKCDQVSMRFQKLNRSVGGVQLVCNGEQTQSVNKENAV